MAVRYRFAVCNELFQKIPLDRACRQARAAGYDGFEVAPFTLSEDPASLSTKQRNQIAQTIRDEGLEFVGLHWLLVAPRGLHVTSRDEAVRKRSWEHVYRLIDLCGDLAGSKPQDNGVMIFGSPGQRSTVEGMARKEAIDIFTNGLANAAPRAEARGVKVLIEALPAAQTDVINSLAEAVAIMKQIGSPAVQTMFDTHNAVEEKDSHPELVRRYFPYIQHVHVNEMDGREPGMGDYDFKPLLAVLAELDYSGWVSVEAFDFSRDPQEIAERAIRTLKTALPLSARKSKSQSI